MRNQTNLPATNGGRNQMSPFGALQSQIDQIFDDFTRGFSMPSLLGGDSAFVPSLDMRDKGDTVMVTAELPGIDEKDLDISAEGRMLTISGEKKSEHEDTSGGTFRSERSYGRFSRSVAMPFDIDASKVEARFDRGVLKLTIQKPADAMQKTARIPIKH
jgi:HSP20 family protein